MQRKGKIMNGRTCVLDDRTKLQMSAKKGEVTLKVLRDGVEIFDRNINGHINEYNSDEVAELRHVLIKHGILPKFTQIKRKVAEFKEKCKEK